MKIFKHLYFLAAILTLLMNNSCSCDAEHSFSSVPQYSYETTLSQYGITWYIQEACQNGQFVNGDYWVVGPVTITHISPECGSVNGLVVNGSMVDPKPSDCPEDGGRHQGYGETVPNYDASYNSALPNGIHLSDENPLVINPGSCIVSTISTPGEGNGPHPNTAVSYDTHLRTCAILTVLDAVPPAGSFRPSYCSYPKTVTYNESSLASRYSLLQTHVITSEILDIMLSNGDITAKGEVENAVDALNNVADYFERPWLDYIHLSNGRPYHPLDNMPEYGQSISNFVSLASVMLQLDYTNEQKRNLLVRFVQYGIDLYGVAMAEAGAFVWRGSGGQSSGRKWPILFAGIMLGDTDGMMAIGDVSGDYAQTNGSFDSSARLGPVIPDDHIHFGEDAQTFYVTAEEIAAHVPYFHNQTPEYEPPNGEMIVDEEDYNPPPEYATVYNEEQRFYPYRPQDEGLPEYGMVHWNYPAGPMALDSKNWMAPYRHCTSNVWSGFVLAALMMDAKDLWNHDALFDYVDRFVTLQSLRIGGARPHDSRVVEAVWNEYRDDYPPVWAAP